MSDALIGLLLMSVAIIGMGGVFGFQSMQYRTILSENSMNNLWMAATLCYYMGALMLCPAAGLKGLPVYAAYAMVTVVGGGLALVLTSWLWNGLFTGLNWLTEKYNKNFVAGK